MAGVHESSDGGHRIGTTVSGMVTYPENEQVSGAVKYPEKEQMPVVVKNPEEGQVSQFFKDIYETDQYIVNLKNRFPLDTEDSDLHNRLIIHDIIEKMGRKLIHEVRRRYGDPIIDPISQAGTFSDMVESMGKFTLDELHKKTVEELMVEDPKRKVRVPSRFCSFHLAGFDLDDESTAQLGPPYEPSLSSPRTGLTNYVTADAHYKLANYCTDVVSIRVIKAGPRYRYPVKVYGKVIARDQIDYECVYLFNRERKDAQTITSEMDMLALTGPFRALVTLGFMYFEFDLKVNDEDDPDNEVQFSKGVIPYYCKADRERIILQLPSFQSTVKLVLQHVDLPVAASIEVCVVKQGHNDPLVHFNGKITAGTTRSYRQHTVLYDSSVPSSKGLLRENGALALNRNLVAVKGHVRDPALKEGEKLVLYVCFLDADCEIEDEDEDYPEPEDDDDDDDEEEEEEEEEDDDEEGEEEEEEEEDVSKVVALQCPLREAVCEYHGRKLEVKVNWTAILAIPKDTDFFERHACLPAGCSFDYRWGHVFE